MPNGDKGIRTPDLLNAIQTRWRNVITAPPKIKWEGAVLLLPLETVQTKCDKKGKSYKL